MHGSRHETSLPPSPAASPLSAANPRHRRFIQLLAVACVAGAATWWPLPADLRSALAVAAMLACAPVAVMAMGLRRDWPPAQRAPGWMWIGTVFITAAVAFDIVATLYHSPTLEYEANPLAGALLDNDAPLGWVLALGGMAQLSVALTLCMLWANFAMRRDDYLQWLAQGDARIALPLRLLGARTPSWVNVLLGRDGEPGVQIVALGPFALAFAAYRLWLGLEWFGWVPISRAWVPALCLAATFGLLIGWASRGLRARARAVI